MSFRLAINNSQDSESSSNGDLFQDYVTCADDPCRLDSHQDYCCGSGEVGEVLGSEHGQPTDYGVRVAGGGEGRKTTDRRYYYNFSSDGSRDHSPVANRGQRAHRGHPGHHDNESPMISPCLRGSPKRIASTIGNSPPSSSNRCSRSHPTAGNPRPTEPKPTNRAKVPVSLFAVGSPDTSKKRKHPSSSKTSATSGAKPSTFGYQSHVPSDVQVEPCPPRFTCLPGVGLVSEPRSKPPIVNPAQMTCPQTSPTTSPTNISTNPGSISSAHGDTIPQEQPLCTPRMEARLPVLIPATSTSPATQTYCTRVNPTAMPSAAETIASATAASTSVNNKHKQNDKGKDKDSTEVNEDASQTTQPTSSSCSGAFPHLDDETLSRITTPTKSSAGGSQTCAAIAEEGVSSNASVSPTPTADEPVTCNETFTHEELQDKFTMLALAFETNRTTLQSRAEHQKRRRDIGEVNLAREIRELTVMLERQDNANEENQAVARRHCDVVSNALTKLSSRAEIHGAVQQELRINTAVEIMVKYVESLKRLYEKELEENRRPLRTASESGSELRRGADSKRLARRATVSVLINKKTPVKTRQRSVTMETPSTTVSSATTPTSSCSAPATSPTSFTTKSPRSSDPQHNKQSEDCQENSDNNNKTNKSNDQRNKQKSQSPTISDGNASKKGVKPTLSFKKIDINDNNIASGARSPTASAVDVFRASLLNKGRGLQSPGEWRSSSKSGHGSPPPLPSESSLARRKLTAAVWKGLSRAPSFINSCVKDSVKQRFRRITAVIPIAKLRMGLSITLVVFGVLTLIASLLISSMS